MDWSAVRIWSLCLLVLSPVVIGIAKSEKVPQDATEPSKDTQELSESNVVFIRKENSPIRDDSTNKSNKNSDSEESQQVFQIETPVRIRKIRRRLKSGGRAGKSSKVQNSTSAQLTKESSKQSVLDVQQPSDSSVPEESLRVEEVRHKSENTGETEDDSSDKDSEASINDAKFVPSQFVPSRDFPKNLASHQRQDSSRTRTSANIAQGEIGFVVNIQPGSSEETSRSDVSSEHFESQRRRNPSNFNDRQLTSDRARNQHQGNLQQSHQTNQFRPEAQKVTIVKEKTVHSTSSEAAQERVNIEKNPFHKQPANQIHVEQQQRTFHSPQNLNNLPSQHSNNQDEKIIFIEGTHIPGRNYGPEDDTFGFYANSYKDEKETPQHPNRKKVKVIKVIKTKPEGRTPSDVPLDKPLDHGNGQSRQYFLSEQSNAHINNGLNHQSPDNQFHGNDQPSILDNIAQLRQKGQNEFPPSHANINAQQNPQIPVQQNLNIGGIQSSHHQQTAINNGNNFPPSQGEQHIFLNIKPEPNELYIDENTGQLIKFVLTDDLNQPSNPHSSGAVQNDRVSNNNFPHRFPEAQGKNGVQINQQGNNQFQLNAQADLGRHNTNQHFPANAHGNQQNIQQENVQYMQIPAVYSASQNGANNQHGTQIYFIPQDQASGQQYVQGVPPSNDESEEYVLVCDQNSQDYSAEYQAQDIGSGENSNGNAYQQSNFPPQNQLQNMGQGNINHNKGQPFQSTNQGGNSDYGNQQQNFQPQGNAYNDGVTNIAIPLENPEGQGHYQGHEIPSNKGANNFPAPQINVGAQGQYKGSQLSNNKGGTNFGAHQINTGIQGHYMDSQISNNKGGANFPSPQINVGGQGQYNQNEFSNNKGGANFPSPQINVGGQGQYNQNEFSNNKGTSNFGVLQQGGQGNYKGSQISNNKGAGNIHQGNYKGSQISNNKGAGNIHQINTGAQGHFKGSELPIGKGNVNLGAHQVNIGAQGQNKGSDFSNYKGNTNYATSQHSAGGIQSNFGGSGFPNSNDNSNYANPQINAGNQGQYEGSGFSKNNAPTHFSPPQVDVGVQNNFKGSDFPNNQGNTNYAILQVNSGAQGQYKGSGVNNDKGVTNFAIPQPDIRPQNHNKGSQFTPNKGSTNYGPPQANVGGQNQYKGSQFPNLKQNPNMPVYREVVTPAYPSGNDFPSLQGNNKGTNFQAPQNQGNYNQEINNIVSQNNYRGSGQNNQKGYNIGNNVASNNKGYSGGSVGNNKGTQFQNQQDYAAGNEFSNNQNYGGGANSFAPSLGNNKGTQLNNNAGYGRGNRPNVGNILSGGNNKGSQFPAQGGYNANQFSGNQGYKSGQNQNYGSVNTNQKGYNAGTNLLSGARPAQGINKGTDYSSSKGIGGMYEIQAQNIGGQSKGSGINNQKGYNIGNQLKGMNIGNQKGYGANNIGISNNQNFGGKGLEQSLSIGQYGTDSGISSQKGYNQGNNLLSGGGSTDAHSPISQFSGQTGYSVGNNAFSNSAGYTSGEQFIDLHTLKGDQGDLMLLIQKGYNAESDVFPPNKAQELFSSKAPGRGSGISGNTGYNAGNSKGQIGSQGYNLGNGAQLFQSLNKGPEYSNNRPNVANNALSGNKGHQTVSISESYSGALAPTGSNKGRGNSNPKGYNSANNVLSGNQDNTYSQKVSNNFKGTPAQLSQNSGYGNQAGSLAAHNNFKGSNSQQTGGNSGYGNQEMSGYGQGASNNALNRNQNTGNNQYGVAYSSSEEIPPQIAQQFDSDGPIQLLLVEEDIPGHKNGNEDALYYIQYDSKNNANAGNNQEQSYLIVDDSALRQNQNYRVMVDGGKDRTFPMRQLATAAFHTARSVLPQLGQIQQMKKPKSKTRSISGNFNFGIQISKNKDRLDNSPTYIQARIDEKVEEKAPSAKKEAAKLEK